MAKVGGYWREAATVILVARTPVVVSRASHAVKHPIFNIPFDYKILLLKRSSGSSFMPEQHVFPGGTLSDADFDSKWIKLFEKFTKQSFESVVKSFTNRKVPAPAFERQRNTDVPAEIAFRICAIRECFEECGVLLAKEISGLDKTAHAARKPNTPLSSKNLNSTTWRKRVNKNANEFLSLCLQHNLVPDLWALQEWCNWLTPVTKPVTEPPAKPRRFDTLFYVCCLDEMPPYVRVDGRETTVLKDVEFENEKKSSKIVMFLQLKWASPGEFLAQHYSKETSISGPQLYELSRLCNFPQFNELREYTVSREVEGIVRYMPVIILCNGGILSVYPGDVLYPKEPDYDGRQPPRIMKETIAELNSGTRPMNRTFRDKSGVWKTRSTVPVICGLVNPAFSEMNSAL